MSFMDRFRNAPVEPSAEERATAVRERCAACLTDASPVLTLLDIGGGYGKQPVCEDPRACRQTATAAGIWKRYPR